MQLGKGTSRLEREVEVWEGNVRGKRVGYREKVKARQSVGDTTVGTVEGDEEEGERGGKRVRIDVDGEEGQGREESVTTTGEISKSTEGLRIGNGKKKVQEQEEDDVEEDVPEEDSDEQDDEEEEDEQDQEGSDVAEDTLDMEDLESQRKKGTLAPDGRVEVDNSDDDSDG